MAQEKSESPKCRDMMYMQFLDHMSLTMDELKTAVERLNPERYAMILHDKDTDENGKLIGLHVHLMMSFKHARHVTSIAKQFKDKPQYIQLYGKNPNNGYAYLIHATKKARNKYQYDPAQVIANFDYRTLVEREIPGQMAEAKEKRTGTVRNLLDMMYIGAKTKREVEAALSGSQYGRYRAQIEAVWAKRLQIMAAEWRGEKLAEGAQVQVIWIYGPAGCGKTSFAKVHAKKKGQDYFVSGSSRDPFQGYCGEHTMILDELRPNSMEYSDLLRILDPFSIVDETMAPARYSDKALACDLIIITGPYDPFEFYKKIFGQFALTTQIDSFNQLWRRLSLVVKMDYDSIEAMTGDEKGYHSIPGSRASNPYSQTQRPAPKVNRMDIYRDMLGSAIPVTDSTPENEITATAVAAPLKNQNEGGGNNEPGTPEEN